MAALLSATGFLMTLAVAVLLHRLPAWLLWLDCGASLLAVLLYVHDKHCAIAGQRRIAERTLHGVALAGGWPGALVAQTLWRHKTVKRGFRRIFWMTVLCNCAAPVALLVRH